MNYSRGVSVKEYNIVCAMCGVLQNDRTHPHVVETFLVVRKLQIKIFGREVCCVCMCVRKKNQRIIINKQLIIIYISVLFNKQLRYVVVAVNQYTITIYYYTRRTKLADK